jgi:hypothetical protein
VNLLVLQLAAGNYTLRFQGSVVSPWSKAGLIPHLRSGVPRKIEDFVVFIEKRQGFRPIITSESFEMDQNLKTCRL